MRILLLADEENKALWDYYQPKSLEGIDLILSAGDLPSDYLEFLVTMANCPLLYVRGNHDVSYSNKPPRGCIDIDSRVFEYRGLRVLGLGGCMRYRQADGDQYTEGEMKAEIRKVRRAIALYDGFDILLTHAPARGCGDLEDTAHKGFACFNDLLEKYRPMYMIHGHVHAAYGHFIREREHSSGTRVINACGSHIIEVDDSLLSDHTATDSALYRLIKRWNAKKIMEKE